MLEDWTTGGGTMAFDPRPRRPQLHRDSTIGSSAVVRQQLRLRIVSAVIVGALALAGIEAPAIEPSVRLFDLITARGIAGEQASEPTRVFAPDDVIYLWYGADGCVVGTTIRSTWLYLETDPPFQIAEGEVTVTHSGSWGQFNFKLADGGRWAIGRYRIQLRVGDDLMAETDFWVAPAQTADAVGGGRDKGRALTWRARQPAPSFRR